MKFRLLAGIIFLVVVLIHVYLVFPHLNLENQIVNFISILILFVIGSVLGIFGRKLDEVSKRKSRL